MKHINKLLAALLIITLAISHGIPLKVYAADPVVQTGTVDLSLKQQGYWHKDGINTSNTVTIESTVKFVILRITDTGSSWQVDYNISGYFSVWSSSSVYESYTSSDLALTINGVYIPAAYYNYDRNTCSRSRDYTQYPADKTLSISVPKSSGATNYGLKLVFNVYGYYSGMDDYNSYYAHFASINVNQNFNFNMNMAPSYNNVNAAPASISGSSYLNGQSGLDKYTVSGKVWDIEQQPLDLTFAVQYYDYTLPGYRSITKTSVISTPPNSQPSSNNFSFTVDINNDKLTGGVSFQEGQTYTCYLTISDGYDTVNIYPAGIIVDKTKPTISATTAKVKGGDPVSYAINEDGDLFLVKDGTYTYDQLLAAADGINGTKKTVSAGSGTITTPAKDGYYKLFMVDRARNVSDVSAGTIIIDTKAPNIISSYVNGDTAVLTFDKKLGTVLPLPDDFFFSDSAPADNIPKFIADDDTVNFITTYDDYESDPVYKEYYVYNFTSCFDIPNGVPGFTGQVLNAPMSTFHNVGLYTLNYYVQDNPKNDDRFQDYRLSSKAVTKQFIIHRRPFALFNVSLTKNDSYYTPAVTNQSYDLDHQSQVGKGIATSVWQWKLLSDTGWTNGSIPTSLSPNTQYQIKLTVQDLEGAWSNPHTYTVDTTNLNLIPGVDANPQTYNGLSPCNVTVTADDKGENDFQRTDFAWSASAASPSSWTNSRTAKTFVTSPPSDGTWYLHMKTYDTSGQSHYVCRGPYTVYSLQITGVVISGYWNHWRGQVDLFGRQMTNEPHRFLSLEKVKVDITTAGNPDKVIIRFSPELEAMQYTDVNGNIYDYKNDYFGYYVNFPADSTVVPVNNKVHWEYSLPLAPSTKDWSNKVLRTPYYMKVTAYKGSSVATYTVSDIDITSNIYDLTYIQPIK